MNAKGVHIFKNANGNNKGYAIVSFQSRRDLLEARKYNLKYYDTNLIWESEKNENQDRKYYNKSQVSDDSVKIYKSNLREDRVRANYEAFCDTNISEENSYQSAYTKKKRSEIREGKKKEISSKSPSSSRLTYDQELNSRVSMDHMLQLIKGLEEKICNMEWDAPYRS